MKNQPNLFRIVFLFAALFFFRCTPEDMDYTSTTKEIISRGEWTVDYYFAGQDKTAQYNTYHFGFLGNGTLEGTNGLTPFTGTWSSVHDVNRNEILSINITTPHMLDLNEQWNVSEISATSISLR